MNSPGKRLAHAALVTGILLCSWGRVRGQKDPGGPVAEARELLRGVTGRLSVPNDLWGGPVEPEKVARLERMLERAQARAREGAAAELASFDAKDFARLFDPGVSWSDEELGVLFAAILRRRKAPPNAMDVLNRVTWDERRLLRMRVTAAVAAVRLGRRSAAPVLLFAARVASELVAATDVLLDTVGEDRREDRARLTRFRERWRAVLEQVAGELRRHTKAEELPELTPGDWGALDRWDAWWVQRYKPPPTRGIVKDAYGTSVWVVRGGSKEAGFRGQVESIMLSTVREYVVSSPARTEVERLSADVVGATRRLERTEGGARLLVNVGSLVKEYSYNPDAKSWQCTRSYRLLDSKGLESRWRGRCRAGDSLAGNWSKEEHHWHVA